MENKLFFENLRVWSKRKHRLLEKYLYPFSAKVAKTTKTREVFCVDGFAGAARYDDGSDGSPLLIAKVSDECATWSNPISLRVINVEPDSATFRSLENETQPWIEKGVVENMNSTFEDSISTILTRVRSSPTLFFVDPYGPMGVRFLNLIPILKRKSAVTELIINFNVHGLNRIACASISEKTNRKTAITNADNVSAVIGRNTWHEHFDRSKPTGKRGEEILLSEYLSHLREFDFYVVDYAIREALNKEPKYHFVYCTRHTDGMELMNDFVRKEDDLIYGEHIKNTMPLFQNEASIEIEKRRKNLRQIVILYLEKNRTVDRKTIKRHLILNYFGRFGGDDCNFVVNQLINEGILRERNGKTRINDTDILHYLKS